MEAADSEVRRKIYPLNLMDIGLMAPEAQIEEDMHTCHLERLGFILLNRILQNTDQTHQERKAHAR
jgi:hypothetical protein